MESYSQTLAYMNEVKMTEIKIAAKRSITLAFSQQRYVGLGNFARWKNCIRGPVHYIMRNSNVKAIMC